MQHISKYACSFFPQHESDNFSHRHTQPQTYIHSQNKQATLTPIQFQRTVFQPHCDVENKLRKEPSQLLDLYLPTETHTNSFVVSCGNRCSATAQNTLCRHESITKDKMRRKLLVLHFKSKVVHISATLYLVNKQQVHMHEKLISVDGYYKRWIKG